MIRHPAFFLQIINIFLCRNQFSTAYKKGWHAYGVQGSRTARWSVTVRFISLFVQAIQDSLALDTVNGLQEEVENMTDALIESLCVMVVALILFPLVIIAVYRLTSRIQAYAQTLQVTCPTDEYWPISYPPKTNKLSVICRLVMDALSWTVNLVILQWFYLCWFYN